MSLSSYASSKVFGYAFDFFCSVCDHLRAPHCPFYGNGQSTFDRFCNQSFCEYARKNLSLRRECERIRSQFIVLRMAYSIIVAIDDNVYCLLVLLFDNFVEATLARRWLSSQYYAIG